MFFFFVFLVGRVSESFLFFFLVVFCFHVFVFLTDRPTGGRWRTQAKGPLQTLEEQDGGGKLRQDDAFLACRK